MQVELDVDDVQNLLSQATLKLQALQGTPLVCDEFQTAIAHLQDAQQVLDCRWRRLHPEERA